uniref:Uncharacterized protein n=1 Tax=Chaetoceros debilis TaxID=122233 RepID=A0A7S3PXN9_9STRA|mmetsp:Transcript_26247/g.38808  ORF Transcript_26247/g.38808 Transcript_26247/m.38808 type:complete len:180 (+) Transcript_26247:140-679(+)
MEERDVPSSCHVQSAEERERNEYCNKSCNKSIITQSIVSSNGRKPGMPFSLNLSRTSLNEGGSIHDRLHSMARDKQLEGKKKRQQIKKVQDARAAARRGDTKKDHGKIPLSKALNFYDRCMRNKVEKDLKIAKANQEKTAKIRQMSGMKKIPIKQASRLHYESIGNHRRSRRECQQTNE